MTEDARIRVTALLKDDLTGPLRRVEQALDGLKKKSQEQINISKKAAYQASREGKAFERLAKQEKVWFDARTRRWKQGNKFISQMKVEELRMRAHATRMAASTTRLQKFTDTYNKLQGFLTQGAVGHARRAKQWQRLVGVYTTGAQKVAAAHWKMQFSMAKAFLHGQAAQARFVKQATRHWNRFTQVVSLASLSTRWSLRALGARTATVASTIGSSLARGSRAAVGGLSAIADAARNADRDVIRLSKSASRSLGKGYAGAGMVAGIGAAAAGYLGMTRINQMQAADVKLGVMGEDEAARKDIISMVDQTVRGTFVTLGEGMTMATQQMGAGVSRDDLDQRMAAVTDLAALYAPQDVGRVSMVTSQIQAKGRLTGEEALQLGELGAPVYDWVAEDLGVDKSQVADIIADGKYTADQFFAAMAPRIAGGAKKMGETFLGSWMLFKAGLARAGEAFLTPLLDPMRKGLLKMTEFFDAMKPWLATLGSMLGQGLDSAVDRLPMLFAALKPLGLAMVPLFHAIGRALPGIVDGFTAWAVLADATLVPVILALTGVLEVLAPHMWIIVPAVLAVAHALAGLFILYRLVQLFDRTRTSVGFMREQFHTMGTTISNTRQAMRAQMQTAQQTQTTFQRAAGPRGLGAFNTGLRTMGNRLHSNRRLLRGIGGAAGAAGAAIGAALLTAEGHNAAALDTAVRGSGTAGSNDQLDQQFRDAKYANRNGSWLASLVMGSPRIDSAGQAAGRLAGMPWWERALNNTARLAVGIPNLFGAGIELPWDQVKAQLGTLDSSLAAEVQAGNADSARGTFSRLLEQAAAEGVNEDQVLKLMPELKALRQAGEFYSGGYTGDGPTRAPAGIVHGQEFVTNAWATRRLEAAHPGGLATANATGQWPAAAAPAMAYSPTVQITVGSDAQAADVAAAVRAELDRQARRMSRQYATTALRGAH